MCRTRCDDRAVRFQTARVRGYGDVVLRECAWHHEVIVESRHIARRIGVTLDGESSDPRLAARGSTDGRFAKRGVVPIPLEDFAELMIVALSRTAARAVTTYRSLIRNWPTAPASYRRVSRAST